MLAVINAIITDMDWTLVYLSTALPNALLVYAHTVDYNKSGAGKYAHRYPFL